MKPVQKATTPTVPAIIVASAMFSIYHLPVAPPPSRERSREAHSQDRLERVDTPLTNRTLWLLSVPAWEIDSFPEHSVVGKSHLRLPQDPRCGDEVAPALDARW